MTPRSRHLVSRIRTPRRLGSCRYCCSSREGVDVLRENPDHVAAVADTLAFEHKYTSAVIAGAPDDRPTDAQIDAVFDIFERTAWAGLEPARYAWTAVQHRSVRPGDGPAPQHRAAQLAAHLRPAARRLQRRAPPTWTRPPRTLCALPGASSRQPRRPQPLARQIRFLAPFARPRSSGTPQLRRQG